MEGLWTVSHAALWVIVALELLFIIALARQIGVLSLRVGPAGARTMNIGPEIGSSAPSILALDLRGHQVTLGVERGHRTIIVFVSPTCSTCTRVIQGLRALVRKEQNTEAILIASPDHEADAIRAFADENQIVPPLSLVVSADVGSAYQVQMTPYAVLVDASGIVRAKGLVNHIEHLESLLNAEELSQTTVEVSQPISAVSSSNAKGKPIKVHDKPIASIDSQR